MPDRSNGFTLLETLIALLLAGIGILTLTPMFIHAMETNSLGSDLGRAGALAVARMELMRELDYDSPEMAPGGSLEANVTEIVDYFDHSDPRYVVRWKIADHPTLNRSKVVAVRVVTARPTLGRSKQVSLVSLRSEQ